MNKTSKARPMSKVLHWLDTFIKVYPNNYMKSYTIQRIWDFQK